MYKRSPTCRTRLPLLARASKEELEAARLSQVERTRRTVERGHEGIRMGSGWECRQCLFAVFSGEGAERRRREEGPGDTVSVRKLVADRRGHSLMIADVGGGLASSVLRVGRGALPNPKTSACRAAGVARIIS